MDPESVPANPDFVLVAIGLLGGLSLFLFGMSQMTDALKAIAGTGMRTVLGKLTTNRFSAAFTGAFVTAVVQSSSVTTVLVVGFISAGLMSLQQSVGVIMGANIGSTVTAQLVAFKITDAALPLITIGFAALFIARRAWVREIGKMVMGLGMIFFGMGIMGESTYPLRTYQPFADAMASIDNPLLAILASAAFTAVVQSSAATTGIVIVLAGQGFITLEAGIALALGSNIGTCATAVLAAIGKPRAATQAAAAHVLFNVVGVILWLPFIWLLADMVIAISPSSPDLEGTARRAAEVPRQIANAHTLFNIANTVLFIWFTGPFARLIQRVLPERAAPPSARAQPKFLDEVYFQTPAIAVDRIRLEIGHLGELVLAMMRRLQPDDPAARLNLDVLAQDAEDVACIHTAILGYAQELQRRADVTTELAAIDRLLQAANHLASMGDLLSVNFRQLARELEARQLEPSPETRRMFRELNAVVQEATRLTVHAIAEADPDAAARAITLKADVGRQADALARRLTERLAVEGPDRVTIYQLESGAVEIMKRLYYFAKRAAKTVAAHVDEPDIGAETIE